MFFHFYAARMFKILVDCTHIECTRKNGTEKIDVTDKLDKPITESFDLIRDFAVELEECSIQRLLENFYFIYDHHIVFEEESEGEM